MPIETIIAVALDKVSVFSAETLHLNEAMVVASHEANEIGQGFSDPVLRQEAGNVIPGIFSSAVTPASSTTNAAHARFNFANAPSSTTANQPGWSASGSTHAHPSKPSGKGKPFNPTHGL